MKKYQRLFGFSLILLMCLIPFIPQSSYAYDSRLDVGLLQHAYEMTPADLLLVLKDNFPKILIDNTAYEVSVDTHSTPIYDWEYELADLDGVGERNYLISLYTNTSYNILTIFKITGSNYELVWTSPFDPGRGYLDLVDLNNDNKQEIVINSKGGASGKYYAEKIISWTGTEAKLLVPYTTEEDYIYTGPNSYTVIYSIKENNPIWGRHIDYFDLDRDGKLEILASTPVFDSDHYEIGATLKVFKWQGLEGIVYKEELQTSLFVTAVIRIKPDKWNLRWLRERKDRGRKNHVMGESQDQNLSIGKDDDKSEGSIKVYIGNLANEHTVSEVKLNSIRLNEKLAPEGKVKVKTDKDKRDKEEKHFQGKYLVAEFDKNEAIETIPEIQSGALRKRDKVKISISGQLNDGKFFVGSCDIELEGTIR